MTGSWFLDHLWLVPLLPFLGALLVALVLRPLTSPRVCSAAAIAAVAGSAFVGWGAAFAYFTGHAGETLVPWQTLWLAFTPTFAGNVGVIADDLSMLLVMVVTGVSLLVHIYSTGYLHGEGGYSRYFASLNLFTCSMLGLVLSVSILQIYVFWELVGVSSFLLIGYYWEKPSAVAACKKAFIVTRFADLGFLLGLLVLSAYAGGLDFAHLADPATIARLEGITAARRQRADALGGAGLHGRRRQERDVPAAHLAARRDGGADPGLGADPRRDHGRRRRLPRGAPLPALLGDARPA